MENISPKRKQIRLKGYDYSQSGYYFVTICTEDKGNILSAIQGGEMILNQVGKMVEKWWFELGNKYPTVKLQEFVVMPNHIHGIIQIVGADLCVCPQKQNARQSFKSQGGHIGLPLPTIIQWFKTMTTNDIYQKVKSGKHPRISGKLWQRNYYEHIIRTDEELQDIRKYITDNPKNWKKDKLYYE